MSRSEANYLMLKTKLLCSTIRKREMLFSTYGEFVQLSSL